MNRWVIAIAMLAVVVQHFTVGLPQGAPGNPGNTIEKHGRISQFARDRFAKFPGETDIEFASRMNILVHESTFHCEPTNFTLSWLEKFVRLIFDPLLSEGILVRSRFSCGFCHQRAFMLANILRLEGINASLLGLGGHVVTKVELGKTVVFDPDYGVGPLTEFSRESIESVYESGAWRNSKITEIYLSEENNDTYPNRLAKRAYEEQKLFFLLSDSVAALLLVLALMPLIIRKKRVGSENESKT